MDRITESSEHCVSLATMSRERLLNSLKLELGTENFHASDGWLQKFLKRHSFSLCWRTTVGQRLPQDLITKVVGFIKSTRKLRHSNKYPLSFISNMDEFPLWLDMPRETTIAR